MSTRAHKVMLLGPQRLAPTVGEALKKLGLPGPVAVITAGWQEREAEDQELQAALGQPIVNLGLHARADEVFSQDSELFAGHRAKQDQLRRLQKLYRLQLAHSLAAARELHTLLQESNDPGSAALIHPEFEAAITALRHLDAHHLHRVQALEQAYETRFHPNERPAVLRQRQEIGQLLASCTAIAISGGHVATLITRIRLFGLEQALSQLPVIAWSAGAMAMCDRVVLFHDFPPQGRGDPEILCAGFGFVPGIVALPHAKRRLLLDDQGRVSLFARRFAPAQCVALNERCELYFDGQHMSAGETTHVLHIRGHLAALESV